MIFTGLISTTDAAQPLLCADAAIRCHELFLNQLMFLLPLAQKKCYAVLMLPLAFFLWKGSVEGQEQGMATQGQLLGHKS